MPCAYFNQSGTAIFNCFNKTKSVFPKKALSVNNKIVTAKIALVILFQPLSSTPLPINIHKTSPGTAFPIIICANPPKNVPKIPGR